MEKPEKKDNITEEEYENADVFEVELIQEFHENIGYNQACADWEKYYNTIHFPDEDGICYYCGEKTNSLSCNPGEWCTLLPHKENPGVCKPHHNKCIMQRLEENT